MAGLRTRDKILRQGLAMTSQGGLDHVTLGTLAAEVGMSKSGLFAHFRSKEDVQISLLRHLAEFAGLQIVQPAMNEPEGFPRLRALIQNWFGWAPRAGLPGGCPIAAGLFEFDDMESPVRTTLLELESDWRQLLSHHVQQAIWHGHLRADLDVPQFLWELSGIYLAHHASQRFFREPQADQRAETALQALFERAGAV